MSAVKPLSKRAAARARRAAKIDAKIQAARDLREALARADAICTGKMPDEFQAWGAVRTRAYMKLIEILQYRSTLITIKAVHLQTALAKLDAISSLDIDECHAISMMNAYCAINSKEHLA